MKQGTEEWFQARLGKVTASRIADATSVLKSGEMSAEARKYALDLVYERLTGQVTPHFINADMQWGIDTEDQARAYFELILDREVIEAPFVVHPSLSLSGGSPDGYIGEDTILEIKCPKSTTHLSYLDDPLLLIKQYNKQIQWNMAVTNRTQAFLCSFDPRFPPKTKMLVCGVKRDDVFLFKLEIEVKKFLEYVQKTYEEIMSFPDFMEPKFIRGEGPFLIGVY